MYTNNNTYKLLPRVRATSKIHAWPGAPRGGRALPEVGRAWAASRNNSNSNNNNNNNNCCLYQ